MTLCAALAAERLELMDSTANLPIRSTIWLAEDDTDLRQLIAEVLRMHSHTVIEYANGLELAEAVISAVMMGRTLEADIIISDIRMPYVDGLEVLSELRNERKLAVPVMLITAFGSEFIHDRARRLGAAAVIDKPFNLSDLPQMVQAVLRRQDDKERQQCTTIEPTQ